MHAKGTHPRETKVLEAIASHTKERIAFGPDALQSRRLSKLWSEEAHSVSKVLLL